MTICFDVKDEKEMRFGGAYYSASDLVEDKPTYIKSVVYNKKKSTTAVIWSDGTATKAVCNEHDTYNPEQGLLVAVMRKMCVREFVNKLLSDWVKITLFSLPLIYRRKRLPFNIYSHLISPFYK